MKFIKSCTFEVETENFENYKSQDYLIKIFFCLKKEGGEEGKRQLVGKH